MSHFIVSHFFSPVLDDIAQGIIGMFTNCVYHVNSSLVHKLVRGNSKQTMCP